MMDPKIQLAIQNAIELFAESKSLNAKAINDELVKVFSADDDFLYEQVKSKYEEAYCCTEKIEAYLRKVHNSHLSKDEKVYVTLHIHRVTKRNELCN